MQNLTQIITKEIEENFDHEFLSCKASLVVKIIDKKVNITNLIDSTDQTADYYDEEVCDETEDEYVSQEEENQEQFFDDANDFVYDLNFNSGQLILDPSCGSGSFLFNSNAKPNQIFGVDNDPIAVMIAKFNYFIKFPDADYPNIFCDDFFRWVSKNYKYKFDYIIGNPPYGASLDLSNIESTHIKSGESFSYFMFDNKYHYF